MSTKKLVRFDWAMKYILRNKANFDVLEAFLVKPFEGRNQGAGYT